MLRVRCEVPRPLEQLHTALKKRAHRVAASVKPYMNDVKAYLKASQQRRDITIHRLHDNVREFVDSEVKATAQLIEDVANQIDGENDGTQSK
jgi:hypothetical protein